MQNRIYRNRILFKSSPLKLVVLAALSLLLSGCSNKDSKMDELRPLVKTDISAKQDYDYEEVECSDVDVSLHIELKNDGDIEREYHADHSDMEVKNINVKEGDSIHKGDILVEFKSDDIESKIREFNKKIEEDELLLGHIERMKTIYPSKDYSYEENRIQGDLERSKAEKAENLIWLEGYTITAENDGVVTKVSDVWRNSKVGPDDLLVRVVYSSGKYNGSYTDDYQINIGDTYEILVGVATRQIMIDDVYEEEASEGEIMPTRYIEAHLLGSEPTIEKTVKLDIKKDILKDAICISKDYVSIIDGRYFVYVLDENNFPRAREIKVIRSYSDKYIIESNLEENEKVVSGL